MNIFKHMFRNASTALVLVLSIVMLAFFVKGDVGNPIAYQTEKESTVAGPYESSNSRSRYVLTEALVENNKATLTEEQAKFASPDVSRYNDKFFSIFMPGISFIGIPFYMLGKLYDIPQLTTYLSVTLFGFINMLLIARIAYKLGANKYASLLGGFLFLFGTNALPYSLFFTQHITSVTLMLLGLLVAMSKKTIINAVLFGALVGSSFLLDVPNVILFIPIGLAFLMKFIAVQKESTRVKLSFNPKVLTVLIGILPFLGIMAWYNLQTTGTFTKIGQSVGQSTYFIKNLTSDAKKEAEKPVQAVPFTPRSQMSGFYTLLVSNERSWLFYSPIVLLGIFGIFELYKKQKYRLVTNAIVGTILLNIVLYGMFHDPWGGWAFGPRYLIPAAAMMCIGLALAIQAYKRQIWFIASFGLIAICSIAINVLGALTTSLIPPRHEAIFLANHIPYTIEYNIQLANSNTISSLFYNMFFSNVSGLTYIGALATVLVLIAALLYRSSMTADERRPEHVI
jgi:hypothetical protein